MNKQYWTPQRTRETIDYFCDSIGFRLTEKQFFDILHGRSSLVESIEEFGPYDTCCRESFMCDLAEKIVGRDWPCNGDGKEVAKAFFEEMTEKGRAMGYDIPDTFGDVF